MCIILQFVRLPQKEDYNKMEKNIVIVVGTRPEIIKMSPVIKRCQKRNIPFKIIHTGQHYSLNMDSIFFKELDLPQPDFALEAGQKASLQGDQTGLMLKGIEKVLTELSVRQVVVQGDTNSVLAGALAAVKMGIPVGHVEAGLRSYDRSMPEEINRVIADQVSDYLYCPTPGAAANIAQEGGCTGKVFVTGNTIVDAVLEHEKLAAQKSKILKTYGLTAKKFLLVTVHRQENVDSVERFTDICEAIQAIDYPILYPIHPRSLKQAQKYGLLQNLPQQLQLVEPVGYLDFLQLEKEAALIVTDSGGLQEEACILNTPCLTLRENTERPETVTAGGNRLIGWRKERILAEVAEVLEHDSLKNSHNPFGDGKSADTILDIILAS